MNAKEMDLGCESIGLFPVNYVYGQKKKGKSRQTLLGCKCD